MMSATTLYSAAVFVTLVPGLPIPETDQRCTCPPGEFVSQPCDLSNNKEVECKQCPHGTFNNRSNTATSCLPCTPYCVYLRQEISDVCTKTSDTVCVCEEGYSFSVWLDRCIRHSPCPPGQHVKKLGTATEDTVCGKCTNGIDYSNEDSFLESCVMCTDCAENSIRSITHEACTITHDTVCVAPSVTESVHGRTTTSTLATTLDEGLDTDDAESYKTLSIVLAVSIVIIGFVAVVGFVCYYPYFQRNRRVATALQKKRSYIKMHLINLDEVIDYLMGTTPMTITENMKETINAAGPITANKVGKLMDILATRGPTARDEFIKALDNTNNEHIADSLRQEMHVGTRRQVSKEDNQGHTIRDQEKTEVKGTDVLDLKRSSDMNLRIFPRSRCEQDDRID